MLRQRHDQTVVERAAKNDRVRRCLAGGVVGFLWIVPLQIRALTEDDPLQKAVNYLFTGRNDPQDAPEILDRKSCVVVVPDSKSKQTIRYYLGRFRMDTAFEQYPGVKEAAGRTTEAQSGVLRYARSQHRTLVE